MTKKKVWIILSIFSFTISAAADENYLLNIITYCHNNMVNTSHKETKQALRILVPIALAPDAMHAKKILTEIKLLNTQLHLHAIQSITFNETYETRMWDLWYEHIHEKMAQEFKKTIQNDIFENINLIRSW